MAFNFLGNSFAFASLFLISASLVLMLFVILSGYRDVTPLNKTWFLQVDTSKIPGSYRSISQWTYFYICDEENEDCGSPVPALPIGYAWLEDSNGIPKNLIGSYGKNTTSKYFYYMWRFGWVTYLMGFYFVIFGWLSAIVSTCSHVGSSVSSLLVAFGLFWHTIATILMTITFVKVRNSFNRADIDAKVGPYAFGFTWGAWALLLLAMILQFLFVFRKNNNRKRSIRSMKPGNIEKPIKSTS